MTDPEELSFHVLAESIPQLVWKTRENGAIVYANGQFLQYFGVDAAALPTWRLADNVHPDDAALSVDTWKRSLETGEPYEVEYRLRKQDGTHHWFLARGTPYHNAQQKIAGWFGTSTAIDRQHERLERQARVVEAFQRAFVPRALPPVRGLELDAAYFPADEEARVGGDWYDVLELDDGCVLVSIGDVIGHGLAAAFTMTHVRQAIAGSTVDQRSPTEILRRADRMFTLLEASIASALVVIVSADRRALTYASAGHPAPVIATAFSSSFSPAGGILLGSGTAFASSDVEFRPGPDELFVLYTDGLVEARRHIEDDERRLLDAARRAAAGALDAAGIKDLVLDRTPSRDDIAILTLRLRG